MAKFNFGQVNGKKFEPTSWVADENAWKGTDITPMADPQPLPAANSTWDQIKKFDFKGIANDIAPGGFLHDTGIGLSHWLAEHGTGQQNRGMANTFADKPGALQPFFQQQQANQNKEDSYLKANPVNSIAGQFGQQLPTLPLWAMGEGAVGLMGKGLTKSFPSLLPMAEKAGNLLPGFIKGGLKDAATYASVVAPTENIQQGGNLQSLLDKERQIPGVFLGGAGLRGVGALGGKGINAAKSVFSPRGVPSSPIRQTPLDMAPVRPMEPIATTPQQVNNPAMGGPLNRFEVRADTRNPGTAIPGSSPSPVNPMSELPRQQGITTPQQPNIRGAKVVNERQFAQNVRDSQVAPENVKQNTLDNQMTYEPITNKETLNKANAIVSSDSVKARELFDAPSKGISADDVALGESLIVDAIKKGDSIGANKLIADLAEKLTTAGQAVQAASIFKRLTPEGMLLYAQRVVNSANKDLVERLGAKAPKVELTPEDSKFIIETMQRVQKMEEGRPRSVEMARISRLLSDKVPSSLGSKIKAVQRITMLANFRTAVRNTTGNIIMGVAENLKDIPGTAIDMATSLVTKKRSTTLPSLTTQLKGAKKGLGESVSDQFNGISLADLKGKTVGEKATLLKESIKKPISTYGAATQWELPRKKIFQGKRLYSKVLDGAERATGFMLESGDRPFFNAAFDDSIRSQMKLAKVTKPTDAMLEQAKKIAEDRTFQASTVLTKAGKSIHDAMNGFKDFGFGDIVLPFVKTPANILLKAVHFSPLGLERAIREVTTQARRGKFDQKAFVDSISRSATGTGIIMAGYTLAQKGVITGTGDKDKDIASFERNLGKNDFSIKVGDTYFTYDWAQPMSLLVAVGADMYIKGKNKKEAENAVIEGIKSGGETLLKQSFLQGVQKMFGGYAPMDNIESTIYGAPTQFIPTLSGQITQSKDDVKRSTYGGSPQQNALNAMKAKIPGLSTSLEPNVNTSGDVIKQFQGNNNFVNVFLNPAKTTQFKPNNVQKEILRLYQSTGDKTIFPKVAPRSFTKDGNTINLTPKEITTFQQTMGKETESRMMGIVNDKKTGDSTKIKEMKKAIETAYDNAKMEILRARGQ